jgi:pSer/pThr/pTyr-binding forkhead associated (FHA) protein
MELRLIITNGKLAGKEIFVPGPRFYIGRGEGCQIRPQVSEVSRKHCVLIVEEGLAAIEDCGSTNGTFLNEERIAERRELKDGDRIRVGVLGLEVRLIAAIAKKPKVQSVQEAVARTVGAAAPSGDDIDISGWIGNESTLELATPTRPIATVGDTLAGKSMVDTTMISTARLEQQKLEKQKEEQKRKAAGKALHPAAKPTAIDSGTAADDALRQFFHRRKP